MKRLMSVILAVVIFASLALPASATEQGQVVQVGEVLLADGITVKTELILYPQGRSNTRTADLRNNYYDGDTVIATITFRATYGYDGSSAWVVSKQVTQTDTYEGWSYSQKSFTESGATVTLTGKVSKWLVFIKSVEMSMTCDKNGNITAT